MVTPPRIASGWRSVWDPESEVLVLTLTSAILAGLGIALILMGAMPAPAATPASNRTMVNADQLKPKTSSKIETSKVEQTPKPKALSESKEGRKSVGTPAKVAAKTATKPKALERSLPVTLDIPAIGVHTPLMSLGLQSDGTVEVPPLERDAPAGWYKNLSTPGEPGPAVILGHVDSAKDGPAVFYRLRELRPGDRLSIDRKDGSTVRFVVRSVARYPKKDFPTAAVYGPRPGAELRLVTCGGSFDALRRHYRDNIVVFAAMTGSSK